MAWHSFVSTAQIRHYMPFLFPLTTLTKPKFSLNTQLVYRDRQYRPTLLNITFATLQNKQISRKQHCYILFINNYVYFDLKLYFIWLFMCQRWRGFQNHTCTSLCVQVPCYSVTVYFLIHYYIIITTRKYNYCKILQLHLYSILCHN